MNVILQHALAYASNGWHIFPLSRSKIPFKGSHGHVDATTYPEQIRAWFDRPRPPNIGLACGVGAAPIAFDFDSPEALQTPWGASLVRAAAANGGLPDTLIQQTRRGYHALYLPPPGVEIRTRNEPRGSKGGPGLDIKGLGGYIVLTPSISDKGHTYSFRTMRPPAVMPDWLIDWIEELGGLKQDSSPAILQTLGPTPEYLKTKSNQRDITSNASRVLDNTWSAHEEARIRSALAAVPAHGYDEWYQIGLCLYSLNWDRSDGTSIAYDLWRDWSETAGEKFSESACEEKWASFGRNARGELSVGSLFHLAREAGWRGDVEQPPQPAPTPSAAPSPDSGPAIDFSSPSVRSVVFRDTNDSGLPKATTLNAYDAIAALGIRCHHDLFHEKKFINGELISQWAGQMSDGVVLMLRALIRDRHGFDPGTQHTLDAAERHTLENQIDPINDYLAGLQWDGTKRIGSWLLTYLGAADTALNREIGRLVLVAAVRRARHPGTKFDQILVLEGPEGKGKSTAIQILAGRDNFSDAPILGAGAREQQEAAVGVWLYEIAELAGMRKSDVEHVKAFASRQVDSARPAYGRYRIDKPRRCVFIATTNDDKYLKSETGNRRFWPVQTLQVDLEALRRDRDQLWAEAAIEEARGVSIVLSEKLWDAAREEQEKRQEDGDPWLEPFRKYLFDPKQPRTDVMLNEVLSDNPFMQLRADQMNSAATQRAAHCMRKLGYVRYQKRMEHGQRQWRYRLMPHVDGA